jgi:hypothetical protein
MKWFIKSNKASCRICGDWKCSKCGACLCVLSLREQRIAMAYMATYENLLKEITDESYDFKKHEKILVKIGIAPENLIRVKARH